MSAKSQIFDFGRLAMTLRRDLALGCRQYAIRGLAMLGVLTIVLLFMGYLFHDTIARHHESPYYSLEVVFTLGGIIFCALGASTFSNDMVTSGTRLNALMLPASTLEKFISRFLICVVGTFVAYVVCFMIADLIRVVVINDYFGDNLLKVYLISPGFRETVLSATTILAFASCQATYVLGSTIWPKNSFIKTIAALWVFQLIGTIVFVITLNVAIHGRSFSPNVDPEEMKYSLVGLFILSSVIWILFCYITAYFRMKENEIINRL